MSTTDNDVIRDLFGELDEEERARLEKRLAASPQLREERERLAAAVQAYRSLGEEEPPELDLRALADARGSTRVRGRGRRWALQLAASLLIAATAFVAGRATGPPASRSSPVTTAGELRALREETARLRQEVALLGLRQEQASARIVAIGEIAVRARSDPRLAELLLQALREDPSANVRLAAVDALFVAPQAAPGADDLNRILVTEPAEVLRLALLDWIAAARPTNWRELLRAAAEDRSPAVRSRARELMGARS